MAKFTWNEAFEAVLVELVAGREVVSQDDLEVIAGELATQSEKEVTKRQVGAKLRKMEICEVEKAGAKAKSWSDEEAADLEAFVNANANALTYAEIAASFNGGSHTTRQVQGKILSLELTSLVKATEKKVAPKTYTEAEEAQIVALVAEGAFMEDIADALGKTINSVRGKTLSMSRQIEGFEIPAQKNKAAAKADALDGLNIVEMTVEEIAEKVGKTPRGIRSMLSRRGITAADYDGAAKKAKNEEAK